ncbi:MULTISPECIES: type II secretion system F family protein [unclassified Haladaptatus]|uniref:type II secretion system F family protein n=1 Tax=unclassified Haladaptatus TaxID=2622732 RepID=UPI0023E79A22|nr:MULTISPECIES: type II secretion system F family protein [unclassified Haladaptatus]
MMLKTLLSVAPLVGSVALLAMLVATPYSNWLDRLFTRLALATFGNYVQNVGNRLARRRTLQRAQIDIPYRVFASKTLLYSGTIAVVSAILGIYVAVFVLFVISVSSGLIVEQVPALGMLSRIPGVQIPEIRRFVVLFALSATAALLGGFVTYRLRWGVPAAHADGRERRIDESIARTVAFMYALSRGGMAFPKILRALRDNSSVYGESAEELAVATRDMDLLGADILTAIQRVSRRTPSTELKTFLENVSSVLQSGQHVPDFLREEYERRKQEAESRQSSFLELLAAFAEGYVSVLVVGPLFLITVLLIIGLVSGGTLLALQVVVYVLVPLATIAFILYLDRFTTATGGPRISHDSTTQPLAVTGVRTTRSPDAARPLTDGGYAHSPRDRELLAQLELYERFRTVARTLERPVQTVFERPFVLLYATMPLAALWVMIIIWPAVLGGTVAVAGLDDVLIQGVLFVIATFAIVWEVHARRRAAIENAIPELFERLASLNEAGISVVGGIEKIRQNDLGALDTEMTRIWHDINYGADVETALHRFEYRVRAPSVTRAVTLISNAIRASGDIAPVLRIAADEARSIQQLEEKREQEMMVYLIITYISFLVFLTIVYVMVSVFIPSIPSGDLVNSVGLAGQAAGITDAEKLQYEMIFFHAALLQGFFSGLVAGQMSEGTVRAGAKHATIMLLIAYGMFLVL